MKITFDIECTPEEARSFMGLPDVTSMNDLIMTRMEERAKENLDTLSDPQQFLDKMMSASGNMQTMFMNMMSQAGKSK